MTSSTAGSEVPLDIAVCGASGRVGRRVLEFIGARTVAWRAAGCRPRLVALANSRQAVLLRDGTDSAAALERLQSAPASGDVAAFAEALARARPRPHVIVDCTASAAVAGLYPHWLGAGIDVVTANKLGPAADRPLLRAIVAAACTSGAQLHDSTTVGAQLPLLQTLRDLHHAGDRIERFEAVLSGTLSYVLGSIDRGAALSAAVRDAVRSGYAEPHPGCDLSGLDAARKLVILLRAAGHDLELADVERVPLVDAALLDPADPAALLAGLEAADASWRARAALAQVRQERWIYRASYAEGRARVAPERVPASHPLARLAPCENAFVLHSAFYAAAPLTIAGPGAGIDLTAAGVFADLIGVARRRAAGSYTLPVAVEAAA
jgi:homoserine dehydrogenase